MCTMLCRMCAYEPEKGTKSHYRWLSATMWLLGMDPQALCKINNRALNCLANSPSLIYLTFKYDVTHYNYLFLEWVLLLSFRLASNSSVQPILLLSLLSSWDYRYHDHV